MASKKATRSPRKRREESDITSEVIQFVQPTEELVIKHHFRWTERQQAAIDAILDKKTQLVIISGPAGCGKSLIAAYCAMVMLKEKLIKKINYIRIPLEASSVKIGFLPSDLEAKLLPYILPFTEVLKELVSEASINQMKYDGTLLGNHLGYIKGLSFHNSFTCIDELEDGQLVDISLALSRIGKSNGGTGKMVILGDPNQSNIRGSAFSKVFEAFTTEEAREKGIVTIKFTTDDCQRSKITKFIVETLEKLK